MLAVIRVILVWHNFFFLTILFLSALFSHLHAGAGWTGVGAVSNGGMVEPGQGVNGTVLTNQAGMSTAGYHTHWSLTTVALRKPPRPQGWYSAGGRSALDVLSLLPHTSYSVSEAGLPFYQPYQPITSPTAQICKCKENSPLQNTSTLFKQPLLMHLAFLGPFYCLAYFCNACR